MKIADRCCPFCKSKWVISDIGRECPNCKNGSFFTMNLGDIGTAIYFENSDDEIEDYKMINKGES